MSHIQAWVISIVIGAVLVLLLTVSWLYIPVVNPLPSLMIKIGVTGVSFRIFIATMDFFINVILCLPAAWALLQLGVRHIRANTLLALLSFAVTELIVLGTPTVSFDLANWFSYIGSLVALPVSVWLVSKLIGNASNYSFKPRPLRGSA